MAFSENFLETIMAIKNMSAMIMTQGIDPGTR